MLEQLWQQALDNSAAEIVAVVLAIAYLLLAVREHIACWYCALVSTAIFFFIFLDVRLYMEAVLQIYYIAMAVYGWYEWKRGGAGNTPIAISTWSVRRHLIAVGLILSCTALSTYTLHNWTDAELPLLDSFTTWGAIITTVMVARKVLENWIYWLVIDSVSIYLYLDRALYFTSLLFAAYIIIIFFGWFAWLRTYQEQTNDSA